MNTLPIQSGYFLLYRQYSLVKRKSGPDACYNGYVCGHMRLRDLRKRRCLFMYDSSNNPTIIIDRTGPGIAEANSKIGDMKSDISDLEIKVQALYRVMVEQGVDPKLFDAKIEEIMKERAGRRPIPKESKPCPKCGRTVSKNGGAPLLGKCMYCGTNVPFYPSFKEEEEPAAEGGQPQT